jgi:hypothetical protein
MIKKLIGAAILLGMAGCTIQHVHPAPQVASQAAQEPARARSYVYQAQTLVGENCGATAQDVAAFNTIYFSDTTIGKLRARQRIVNEDAQAYTLIASGDLNGVGVAFSMTAKADGTAVFVVSLSDGVHECQGMTSGTWRVAA